MAVSGRQAHHDRGCARGRLGYHPPNRAVNARAGDIELSDEEQRIATPDAPETIEVDSEKVACDGGGGALGHPRVFLTLVDGVAECGYCDRRFVLKQGAKPRHHH
jgi:uncharacterized Zn-finger protein